jgi:methionyl-tRNA formyltransferase
MRILFLGTPAPAAIALERIVRDGRFTIVGIVTQPDRPAGRRARLQPPPVKQMAADLGLSAPLLQPESLRDPAWVAQLAALEADLGVVAAYGEILRRDVLAIPPLGYLNIHPSLLPRYRGPAPVTGAILAGDAEVGVSIIRLTPKMDAGPIVAQSRMPLPADARAGALTEHLFALGADVLADSIPAYAAGTLQPQAQDETLATYTSLLRKEDGRVDWSLPVAHIERMVRAYDPWPSAWAMWRDAPIKILEARIGAGPAEAPPGALLEGARVATADGILDLLTVQPAGRRAMPAAEWYRGQRPQAGERFV